MWSFDRCMSVSRACVPTLIAPLNAPSVFSGCFALYPRCAMVCGKRLPSLSLIAFIHGAEAMSAFVGSLVLETLTHGEIVLY